MKIQNIIIIVVLSIFLTSCTTTRYYSDSTALIRINQVNNSLWQGIYNTSYLQDMRFPAIDLTTAGNSDPTKTTFNGFTVYQFSPTRYEELESTFQYPHIEDGFYTYNVIPHFHWSLKSNITSKQCITWGVQYSCANIMDYFYPMQTRKMTFCYSGNYANRHIFSVMNNITVINRENSRQCLFRVFRDATNTTDNLTQEAILLEFDIHYYYKRYGEEIN